MKKNRVRILVSLAMLSSISYILMFVNFPVPPFPAFLKIDFSDIPALIGAIIFGPMAGVVIELIKNILDYFIKGSETGVPVGHVANFLAGILYILPTYYVYNKLTSKKGMTFALVLGSAVMAIVMSVLNYLVILPAYTFFLNAPAMSGAEVKEYIVALILPFNLIKGVAMSILFMILFTKMGTWLNKQAATFRLN
ncbi:ECF transporter S component [Bacillus sp. DNRA2]|uniref:ECF transporter S component n=1 Tax=Bacillus sp. DNRA2 TaxID=2723053 RepID=UPI00145E8765|nr:ECF transporter S component [Bacillus sp. DNRA2]NMD71015.1 ECF transporter S component [Bacillus sp. DNRA2]